MIVRNKVVIIKIKLLSMENIIVAFSNISALLPLYTIGKHNDFLTLTVIMFVFLMSFFSHLIENHKHGMPGIGFSKRASYYLNRLDVMGCFIVCLRMAYLYYDKYHFDFVPIKENQFLFIFAFILFFILQISEYDKYNVKLKYRYITTHCVWHIGIFIVINFYLNKVIY
jgi:hypothetical protein